LNDFREIHAILPCEWLRAALQPWCVLNGSQGAMTVLAISENLTILKMNHPLGISGYLIFMGDHHNRAALVVENG
jgi:hypothetical protein